MTKLSYGSLGAGSTDPKDLAVKFLKKVTLNHKNSLRFMSSNDQYNIATRFSNSLHILEELDLMLNHEEANEAVLRTSNLLKWLIEGFEVIIEKAENEELSAEELNELVEKQLVVLNNLTTGFQGMKY